MVLFKTQHILWNALCSRGCFFRIAFCSIICHFELQTNQAVIYKQRVTLLYIYIPNLNVPPNNFKQKWQENQQKTPVFCLENCSDLLWEENVLGIEKLYNNYPNSEKCKIVNLQYNTLVCWFAGTNDLSTKHLIFQALFFYNFL